MTPNESLLKQYLAQQRAYSRLQMHAVGERARHDVAQAADLTRWARLYPFATLAAVTAASAGIAAWLLPAGAKTDDPASQNAEGRVQGRSKESKPQLSLGAGIGALASSLLLGAGRMVLMQFLNSAVEGMSSAFPPREAAEFHGGDPFEAVAENHPSPADSVPVS